MARKFYGIGSRRRTKGAFCVFGLAGSVIWLGTWLDWATQVRWWYHFFALPVWIAAAIAWLLWVCQEVRSSSDDSEGLAEDESPEENSDG